MDLDSCLPYRQIIRTTRGQNIKDTLAFHIHATRGGRPLLGMEAKTRNIDEEAGHCSAGTWNLKGLLGYPTRKLVECISAILKIEDEKIC